MLSCTDDVSAEECVPPCSEDLHGDLLLANIDGEDLLFRVATAALGARTIVALASSFLCASLELFVLVFFSRVATAS
jgi:hypothetical protein